MPADNELRITWNRDAASTATVTLAELGGRVVRTVDVPAQKNFTASIPVKALPAGNYVFSVKDASGSVETRMITVAH